MGLRGPRIESNKAISSVRSRIEHSFGFIEESLSGSVVRTVGTIRAKFNIGVQHLSAWSACSRNGKKSRENWRSRIV